MDKQTIQEIIAVGRVRNLSDEQIAEMVMEAIANGKKQKGQQQQRSEQQVDSVSN